MRLVVRSSQPSDRRNRADRLRPGGKGPLLYIAADQDSTALFTRIARRWEQEVHLLVAEGGRAGLRMAGQRRPRIVVLEARLPDVGAEEVVLRLRDSFPATPVVVLSDDDSPSTRARFIWAGANAYITKPLSVAQIDRTVADLLAIEALW